jgi:uroporphyrinogen-III synthase
VPRDQFIGALAKVRVAARGPKPAAALRELGVTIHVTAPEPNTWHELIAALDREFPATALRGLRVAVQEYGKSSVELLAALRDRGAVVNAVPVYRWALPDDVEPLRSAIRALAVGGIGVVLFTTSVQIAHLFQVAEEMHAVEPLREALGKCAIASIGPTTSEELKERGLRIDLEATHPKMGILVKEAAERCSELLRKV